MHKIRWNKNVTLSLLVLKKGLKVDHVTVIIEY